MSGVKLKVVQLANLVHDRELRRATCLTLMALVVISMVYHILPISIAEDVPSLRVVSLVKIVVGTLIAAVGMILASIIALAVHERVSYRAVRTISTLLVVTVLLSQVALPVLAQGGPGGNGDGGGGMGEGLAKLVKMAVDALIVVGGLALAFAIAFTGVSTIFAKMAGMPYAEANATMKVIGVVIAFVLTAFAIPVANAVIDQVMKISPKETIHVPNM